LSRDLSKVTDFHSALMAATAGGVWDDLGWLSMADIQQMASVLHKALRQSGLSPSEPVLISIGGRAEDIAKILAVIGAGGVAVPFHHKSHNNTRVYLESSTRARFVLSTPNLKKTQPA